MINQRHVAAAVVVAPLLSLLAWWVVGEFTGEQARPAQAALSYPLLERSNCRYASGRCDLENGDVQLQFSYRAHDRGGSLELQASHPLQGVLISVGEGENYSKPRGMFASNDTAQAWRMMLDSSLSSNQRYRVVARALSGSTYYGEFVSEFSHMPDNLTPMH